MKLTAKLRDRLFHWSIDIAMVFVSIELVCASALINKIFQVGSLTWSQELSYALFYSIETVLFLVIASIIESIPIPDDHNRWRGRKHPDNTKPPKPGGFTPNPHDTKIDKSFEPISPRILVESH